MLSSVRKNARASYGCFPRHATRKMVLFHLTPALRAALLAIAPSDPSDDSANLLRSIRREKGKSTAVLAGDDTVEDGEVREEVETIDHELLIKFIRASVREFASLRELSSCGAVR